MKTSLVLVLGLLVLVTLGLTFARNRQQEPKQTGQYAVVKTDAEWKKQLSPEAYEVTRREGTERAFTGKLWDNHEKGTYYCVGCHQPLFSSDTKFESGTGWPSFFKPLDKKYVLEKKDTQFGMVRTEVECSRCGAHLGHIFDDGPRPTGLRYCMNSVSMTFEKGKPGEVSSK
ncbi:MAG: peptide-methionine (R)-S-oxide reductase MsrB [Sphingobacteriaceae bacterium]|nr:peptide-methionine (R)-S-oxide reductase MsrB [Cytophagaceae bacterium]